MQKITVFEYKISLRVFDTQFAAQGIKNIGEIWYCLVPFLMQGGPSGVLVLIASKRVALLFNDILEEITCRGNRKILQIPLWPFDHSKCPTNS